MQEIDISVPKIYIKILKVRSCKLYNNKYMIESTQIVNTEISAFITVLVIKLLSRKILFINRKGNRNCRILFQEIVNFTSKLLQNYKFLEYENFRILLKHVSNHLSGLFQFV